MKRRPDASDLAFQRGDMGGITTDTVPVTDLAIEATTTGETSARLATSFVPANLTAAAIDEFTMIIAVELEVIMSP